MKEAKITIGGVELSYAQSMTLRVAIAAFDTTPGSLGDDEHGMKMAANYRRNCAEIEQLINSSIEKQEA